MVVRALGERVLTRVLLRDLDPGDLVQGPEPLYPGDVVTQGDPGQPPGPQPRLRPRGQHRAGGEPPLPVPASDRGQASLQAEAPFSGGYCKDITILLLVCSVHGIIMMHE